MDEKLGNHENHHNHHHKSNAYFHKSNKTLMHPQEHQLAQI